MSYRTTPSGLPFVITAIDLTGDRRLDLLVGEIPSSGLRFESLINKGDGTFALSPSSAAGDVNFFNVVAADFNGDGFPDLVSQNNSAADYNHDFSRGDGYFAIDFGTGLGNLAAQSITFPAPQTTGLLATGDFNGDGRPDLAFAGYDMDVIVPPISLPGAGNFAMHVYLGTGDGKFAAPSSYANTSFEGSGWTLTTGDFDGDGHLDIMEYAVVEGHVAFGVFFNNGDGSLQDETLWNVNPEFPASSPGIADFNGDGIDDIATTVILDRSTGNKADALEVFSGTRNRSFDGPAVYPLAAPPSLEAVLTGDFNGDGRPDMALVMGGAGSEVPSDSIQLMVYENRGDGTFGAPVSYDLSDMVSEYASGIAVGDFNGDGVDDIAMGTTGQNASVPSAVNVLLSKCK